jgi:hypothetical protein
MTAENYIPPPDDQPESGIQSVPGTQGTTQAHTPGPWYALGQAVNVDRAGLEGLASIAKAHQRRGTDSVPITKAEAEANARLIAAAPDLLAALRGVADGSLCFCGGEGEESGHRTFCTVARAAIAKAEGR